MRTFPPTVTCPVRGKLPKQIANLHDNTKTSRAESRVKSFKFTDVSRDRRYHQVFDADAAVSRNVG